MVSHKDSDVRTLQRHSRHTRSKDMAPLAKGTALEDIFLVKTLGADGANAEVWLTRVAMRAREVFMVVGLGREIFADVLTTRSTFVVEII